MAIKMDYKGKSGYFLNDDEMESLKNNIAELNEKISKAEGESKYKLKKLAKMIERKDKKIDKLTSALNN